MITAAQLPDPSGEESEMVTRLDYGLALTSNSKVGWAFSLPRNKTCIGATDLCRKLCYGNGIRYQSEGQKNKRERNFRTIELLLSEGGPELLAENLVMMLDQARPRDWLTARVTGCATVVPWSIRIHDLGDFFESIDYVRAWVLAAKSRPACALWFYTRSFENDGLLAALTELASLPNCQGWLSVDSDNYAAAILAKCKTPPGVWKFAILQDKNFDPEVLVEIVGSVGNSAIDSSKNKSASGEVVSFPYHHGGRHVVPLRHKGLTVCPAVTGAYKLQTDVSLPRPCQSCAFCLPSLSL